MYMSRVEARQFPLPSAMRPMRAPLPIEAYPGVGALWARSSLRHIGDPVFGIEALVIHSARATGTDDALSLMQAGRASWHWIVPAQGEPQHGKFIWSAVPEARAARHLPNRMTHPAIATGRPRLNHATLSVLVAANPRHDGGLASRWQIGALAQLIRNVWSRYPTLDRVICRSEIDPDTPASGLDWALLRDLVLAAPHPDLPSLVAGATPLALLDRPGPAEAALRAD